FNLLLLCCAHVCGICLEIVYPKVIACSLTISCYQNYSNLAYMFWYQQLPRSGLKLIVSSTSWKFHSYEDGYSEAKFEVTREISNYSLMTIKNVTPQDEATYFCAASGHTV
uniref:Ig-like domain-containing protein n=1 Tax=Serinus canaria TaxID=9135 RepID=A0A8C9NJY6_SERCA